MSIIDKKIEQLNKKEEKLKGRFDKIKNDLDEVKKAKEDYIKEKLYQTFEKTEISLSEYLELIEMNNDDIIKSSNEEYKAEEIEDGLKEYEEKPSDHYLRYSEKDL